MANVLVSYPECGGIELPAKDVTVFSQETMPNSDIKTFYRFICIACNLVEVKPIVANEDELLTMGGAVVLETPISLPTERLQNAIDLTVDPYDYAISFHFDLISPGIDPVSAALTD